MLYVENGVYLLETSPAAHNYTYNDGQNIDIRTINSPLLDDYRIVMSSGYTGYMNGKAPSASSYVYSSVSFARTGGTSYSVSQSAEQSGSNTLYYLYLNGTKQNSYQSYNEPGEMTILVQSWGYDAATNTLSGNIYVVWKYRKLNGTYATQNTSVSNVILRQGDRTQTDYTFSVSENRS